jgi:hypothetical protein
MEHNDIRHKLSEYIDGSSTSEERAAIEAHLKTCAQCTEALSELRKTIEHIRQVEEIEPPVWMTRKIMANVRAVAEKKGFFGRFFLPLSIKLPIQAVAVVFLAVTAFYIYRSIQPAPAPSETPMEEFASRKDAANDRIAKADDHALRAKKVPQAPEYKALDMKQEYEKPAAPKPLDMTEAPAPAPAKATEAPMLANEETAGGKSAAAPQAGAPAVMREGAAQSAGLSDKGDLKAVVPARKAKSLAMANGTSSCLAYEPIVVTISGLMNKFDLAGRPNYENIEQGDEKETSWVLKLQKPVCVNKDRYDTVNVSESTITDIQLVLNTDMYQKYRPLLKKQVVVKGTLFHSHTGHHHTPVLLQVLEINPVQQ